MQILQTLNYWYACCSVVFSACVHKHCQVNTLMNVWSKFSDGEDFHWLWKRRKINNCKVGKKSLVESVRLMIWLSTWCKQEDRNPISKWSPSDWPTDILFIANWGRRSKIHCGWCFLGQVGFRYIRKLDWAN